MKASTSQIFTKASLVELQILNGAHFDITLTIRTITVLVISHSGFLVLLEIFSPCIIIPQSEETRVYQMDVVSGVMLPASMQAMLDTCINSSYGQPAINEVYCIGHMTNVIN